MTMLSLLDAQLAFGDLPLLDRAQLAVGDGDRIGLIGRNGSGKSSLLAVIAGRIPLDGGELKRRDGLRVVLVEQEPELPAAHTLRESLLVRGGIEHMHDERERWRAEARLAEYLHRFGLDGHTNPAAASGGERKRGALALALALQPELLLLDEPTNHLDIDAIAQLESLLAEKGAPTLIVITHDRAFLDRVATRIVELDRGALRAYPGNYSDFERRRESELQAEEKAARRFDRFWAQEEAWIRKGIEARRTRNAGRVARLERLRRERAARRERSGRIKLALDTGERSGRLVAELENVTKRFGERVVVRGFSTRILRGDRIGLIGPNGAGKSTLLKLVLGTLAPDSGTVRLGTNLQVAYFDQMREALDPDQTVAETIAPGSDWVEIAGVRKHVIGYLGDFLFPPRRAAAPVSTLSGGERNRLLLARLFAQPANLLVLDEPTNDLDIESLELLEQTLQDYEGTLLLVSHDRAFLDNVVTQTIAAEGDGVWKEYVGGYSDWLAQRPSPSPLARGEGRGRDREFAAHAPRRSSSIGLQADARTAGEGLAQSPDRPSPPPSARKRGEGAKPKLSFKEQRELEALPSEIEALEREQSELTAAMSGADYHRRGADAIRADRARAEAIERLLAEKFDRWAALDEKSKAAG